MLAADRDFTFVRVSEIVALPCVSVSSSVTEGRDIDIVRVKLAAAVIENLENEKVTSRESVTDAVT